MAAEFSRYASRQTAPKCYVATHGQFHNPTSALGLTVLLIVVTLILSGCQSAQRVPADVSPVRITIFAAASLTDGFDAIGEAFTKENPEVEILFNFAGSQQLAQQLAQGAPADLFASANQQQMDVAIEAGRVLSGTTQIFAHNALVVITPVENPGQITNLADLAKPGLKLVLAAEDVPVGRYTRLFLRQAAADTQFASTYAEDVQANIVSNEQNVRAVLTKVLLGEADAGIVYGSDIDADARDQLQQIVIPDQLNVVAAYPIAVVADSRQSPTAQQFVDFLLSSTGQELLAHYGFLN